MIGGVIKLVGLLVIGTLAVYGCNSIASGDGPEVELKQLRTQHSTTVLDTSTGRLRSTFGTNLNISKDGEWQPVDLAFRPDQPLTLDGVKELGATDQFSSGGSLAATATLRRDALALVHPETGVGIRWLLPSPARVEAQAPVKKDREKVAFVHRGLIWEIRNTRGGSKLTASVSRPRGVQTYQFRYELINTSQPLSLDGDTIVGDGFRLPPPEMIDARGRRYSAQYQLSPDAVSFTFDDSVIPADGYPYIIDPTTNFDVDTSANDVSILREGPGYPPDGSTSNEVQATDNNIRIKKSCEAGPVYSNRTAIIAWDTSALPDDATVESAELYVEMGAVNDAEGRSFLADWFDDSPPFTVGDYTDTTDGIAINTPLSGLAPSSQNVFTLGLTGSTIATNGFTTMRFTLSGGAPSCTVANDIAFEAFDSAGILEPRLAITYSTVASQTVPSIGSFRPITAYQNLIESGDLLVLVPYTITIPGGQPLDPATGEYQFIFRDATSWFQVANPVSTSDNAKKGYEDGLSAFYFTNAQRAALGITFNTLGAYTVELDAINGVQNTTSTDIVWRSGSVDDLLFDLAFISTHLEAVWAVNLIQDNRLTTTGHSYFTTVIPGLARMLPQFAAVGVDRSNPTTATHGTAGSAAAAAFWDGTLVATAFTTLATRWGLTAMQLKTIIALFIAGVVIVVGILVPKIPTNHAILAGGVVLIVLPAFAMGPQVMSLILGFIGLALGVFAWQWGRGSAN